ncbi:MAG: hypothetical protein HOO91_21175 [Bacteroidales bacterium]|nr:hypothetical protein [Bacteroidales bacterium]
MARNNFEIIRNAGFDATVHFSLGAITDLIKHAMLQGMIPKGFSQDTEDVTFSPPTIIADLVNGNPIPIPQDIEVDDENDNKVPLQDPVYPQDRQEQDILLKVSMEVKINSTDLMLQLLDVNIINTTIELLLRPYFSPSDGIGFIRYNFQLNIVSTEPNVLDSNIHTTLLAPKILSAFYPVIVDLIGKLKLPIPEIEGLKVTAIRIWPNLDNDEPTTFSIGFGGENPKAENLLGLLDNGDDLMITIGKKLFDQRVTKFSDDNYPSSSYNRDEKRTETVKSVKISLGDDQLYLKAKIDIDDHDAGLLEPSSAEITVSGPLYLTLSANGLESKLNADGSDLDVDIDTNWFFDLTRVFLDIITLGLAEIGFTPGINDAEDNVRDSTSDKIAEGFKDALLGAYPSGLEFAGRNIFYTRESLVLWSAPGCLIIKEDIMMLGGAARGGIKHAPRKDLTICATHHPHNNIKTYGLRGKNEANDNLAFSLKRERATSQWVDKKFSVEGMELIKRTAKITIDGKEQKQTTLYLRDHYNKKEEGIGDNTKFDNLLQQEYFNPENSDYAIANEWEPLTTNKRYGFNNENELVEL